MSGKIKNGLFIIIGFCSCSNKPIEKDNTETIKKVQTEIKESKPSQSTETNRLELTISSVDIQSIKDRFENSHTSGKLSKKKSTNYLTSEKAFFYGVYYFVDPTSQIPFEGSAVVAVREQNGWQYINKSEELVEFIFYSNALNPFKETINIGQSIREIKETLGVNFEQVSDNLMYSDTLGNNISILIEKGKVRAIRVGKYLTPQDVEPINGLH